MRARHRAEPQRLDAASAGRIARRARRVRRRDQRSAARRERVGAVRRTLLTAVAGPAQRLDRGQHAPRQLRARRRRTNPWREWRPRLSLPAQRPWTRSTAAVVAREPKERCSASTPSPRSASRGTHFATLGRRRRDLQTWQTASGRRRRVEGVAVISFIGRRRDQGSSAPPLRSVGGDRWL